MCQEKSFLFEHNREVYEQLENHLSVDNKAIVVLGTGIGKTTTALEYLNNHQVRGLVICPQNAIRADWDKVDEYVDTITYSKFAKVYQDIDYSNYGAVICDEVHHVGADKWGAGIKHIIGNDLCKVIGLTATPDRTDKIDIVNNIFSGNICQGLDMLAGIKEGIVHPFTYVGAYYDTDGLKEENENEERRKEDKEYDLLCGKLDLAINNTPSLNEIITSNMPEGDRKIIVFVSDIDSITEAKQILNPIFPNLEHRSLHSGLSKEEIKENREWFKNTNEGLLYTINMASEGIHYIGVNTLIMFRRTCSDIVFTQQMGRISTLTKYENPNAIVFDLVNNAKTVGNLKMAIKELSKEYSPREIRDILREHSTNEKSNQIIVRDYTGDIVDVLEEMREYDSNRWTEEEDNILREFYPISGAKGCQVYLPKRNSSTICTRATLLNLVSGITNKNKQWSPEEDEIIKANYSKDRTDLTDLIPNKSKGAIQQRASILGVKVLNNWTEEEIKWMQDNSYLYTKKELIDKTGKSWLQINRILKKYGLKYCTKVIKWTEEEDSIIKKYYLKEGGNVYLRLKNRTYNTVMGRASALGIKYDNEEKRKWTEEEDTILKENYAKLGKNIVNLLPGRKLGSITTRAHKIGIKRRDLSIKCVETGEVFNSIKEATEFAGLSSGKCIRKCCKGEHKTAGGYHWEYVEEENEKLNKTEE